MNIDVTNVVEFQAGVDAYRLDKYDEAKKPLEAAGVEQKLPGSARRQALPRRLRHRAWVCRAQVPGAGRTASSPGRAGTWEACIVEDGSRSREHRARWVQAFRRL